MCKHELKNYVGFTDTYQYCHLCGLKENEINAEKPNFIVDGTNPNHLGIPKRTGYTVLVDPALKADEAYVMPAGIAGWVPNAASNVAVLKELYSDDKLYPTTKQYTQYINEAMEECIANMMQDACIWGTSFIKVQSDGKPLVVKPNNYFFGVDRSTEPYRFSTEYKPSEPEEESINITKTEFFQAFEKVRNKKRCRGIHPKIAEEIWTEMEADYNGEPDDK